MIIYNGMFKQNNKTTKDLTINTKLKIIQTIIKLIFLFTKKINNQKY